MICFTAVVTGCSDAEQPVAQINTSLCKRAGDSRSEFFESNIGAFRSRIFIEADGATDGELCVDRAVCAGTQTFFGDLLARAGCS